VPAVIDEMLVKRVTEVIAFAIRIPAPIGGVIGVEARMVAAEDAGLAAVTGGFAGRARTGDQGRAVAADDELVEIAEHAALGRRDDGGCEEQILKAREKILRSELVGAPEQLIFEMDGDGVAARKNLGAGTFFVGFLLVKIAQALLLAELRRSDPMRTVGLIRAIFEAVDEEIESANTGSIAGLTAGNGGQSRLTPQFSSEVGDAVSAKSEHEQQGTEHQDGVARLAASGSWRVKFEQFGFEAIQIEADQEQSGLQPIIGQARRIE